MAISKHVKKSDLVKDPLIGYSGYQLLHLSGPALRELLCGKNGRQPIPARVAAYEKKIAEWKKS